MPPHQTTSADPVSALFDSADAIMDLAGRIFCRPFQRHEWLIVAKEFYPEVGRARGNLYESAQATLQALHRAGANYADAEQRVIVIVGICNSFLEWARRFRGQAPQMPDAELLEREEVPGPESWPDWTPQQAMLVKEQQTFFSAYRDARGDLIRMWETIVQQPRGDAQLLPAAQKALTIIKTLPKGKGITGPEIVARLKKQGTNIGESYLRRHIIPKLKAQYGVENQPSAGGYLIPQ